MTGAGSDELLALLDESRFPDDLLREYEIIECLANNENSETLLVKHRQSGAYFVAKCYFYRSLLANTSEADILKNLAHAGLPAYVGEYRNKDMRCIVRAYVRGQPLDQLVFEKTLTNRQVIAIAAQVCDILDYLHSQTPPIIHRDIKPQNIIVDEQERAHLIDFGISRLYDASARNDTLYFGTQKYAAPEQYGFSQTDPRSDIYALGVLLCWLLTGSEDVATASGHISNLWLRFIVNKCTAFAPKDRFASAAQVRNALTGRASRRYVLAFGVVATIALVSASIPVLPRLAAQATPPKMTFKEPLIERAVRLFLKKADGDEMTAQDLLAVTELFVFGDHPAGDEATFESYVADHAHNGKVTVPGDLRVLDDLVNLKNLRRVSLCDQKILDLTPLAGLTSLEMVDFRHNPVSDVSPLAALPALADLIVFDTKVADLTPLRSCPHLNMVDAGMTTIRSMAAFAGLGSLKILMLRNAALRSLEQMESLPSLEELYLSGTRVVDLAPLLAQPRLRKVELDETMRAAANAIAPQATFQIVYQGQ